MKVIELAEFQLDVNLGVFLAQAIVDLDGEPRLDLPHDVVDRVAVNLHELSILHGGKRLFRLSRKVC
jgi:hypothetical protein